jgi:hypothetical protein
MSITVLHEVYSETRRLAIAGSVVAAGDFRLKKLIDPLKKAGAKAPIFAKVAEYVEGVVGSNDKTAAEKLLDLSSLVCSILFTQGTTGLEGKLSAIESSAVKTTKKQVSARMLKPLIEALTTKGSGRLEQIRSAIDLGLFSDLRLVRPAFNAIDDSYSEIAEMIAEKVLPSYGKAIFAELKSSYDPKGKSGHARRLKLMHTIDAEASREVVKESLTTGSADVKIAAIECLGDSPEDLSYLIEQSKAKAKDLRGAAYHALCKLPDPEALDVLVKAIDGKDTELVADSIGEQKPTKLVATAIERLKEQIPALQAIKDKKKQGEAASKVLHLIDIVGTDLNAAAEKFLKQTFELSDSLRKINSSPSGQDVVERIVIVLWGGSEDAVKYLVDHRDTVPVDLFQGLFNTAFEKYKPKDLFKVFSPYLYPKNAKKNSDEMTRHEAIVEVLQSSFGRYWIWSIGDEQPKQPVDNGWLDLAIANDDLFLVMDLADAKHSQSVKYLIERRNDKRLKNDLDDYAASLIRIGHKDATDIVIDSLKSLIGKKGYHGHYSWIRLAGRLGKDALPKLEELIAHPKLPNDWSNGLLDAINTIRETKT